MTPSFDSPFYDFEELERDDAGEDRSQSPSRRSVDVPGRRTGEPYDWSSETERPPMATPSRPDVVMFADLKGDARGLGPFAHLIDATNTAVESDRGCWEFSGGQVLAWGFLTPGNGRVSEDAEPMFMSEVKNGEVVATIGVFDGMGGSGASASFNEGGPVHSEAYRASRIARHTVITNWRDQRRSANPVGLDAEKLASAIHDALKSASMRFSSTGETKLRGSIKKSFPTTVACALVTAQESASGPTRVNIKVAWAGDSRVWVLTPRGGLQQLTADDSHLADCLEQLQQDPPLTNMASAGRQFALNDHLVAVDGPAIVVAASDGASGYVRSPGEVEKKILDSFVSAAARGVSPSSVMSEVFARSAADDVSAVIVAVGFGSVEEINTAFGRRRSVLDARYRGFGDEVDGRSADDVRRAVWEDERDLYCALMPRGRS